MIEEFVNIGKVKISCKHEVSRLPVILTHYRMYIVETVISKSSVSQMSKAQILDSKAHTARVVHTRGWFDELDAVLDAGRKAA